jgi:hypothetical protein
LLHRLITFLFALLAGVGVAPATAVAAEPQRIVAVGDLHGDYDAWIAIARAARLIDANNRWTGGGATLVQLGDITDRGAHSLKIIRHLQQLQREAPAAGGRVVVILGNHEAMNLLGDLRYVTPGEFAAFADSRSVARRERVYIANRQKLEAAARATNPNVRPSQVRDQWLAKTPLGWVEHRAAWSPSGELGRWASRNPAVAKIGDTLFVHGGLSAEYARFPIDEINRRAAAAMASADPSQSSVISDELGPLWYRGLVIREGPTGSRLPIEQELAAVLAATGTRRIVVGHTPSLKGVIISYGGRLVRADSGNARYYGGPPSYVEIIGDKVSARAVARTSAQGSGAE